MGLTKCSLFENISGGFLFFVLNTPHMAHFDCYFFGETSMILLNLETDEEYRVNKDHLLLLEIRKQGEEQ